MKETKISLWGGAYRGSRKKMGRTTGRLRGQNAMWLWAPTPPRGARGGSALGTKGKVATTLILTAIDLKIHDSCAGCKAFILE